MMDRKFAPLKADMLEMGICVNVALANEHALEIKHWIHVLKEWKQATHHTMTFTHAPKATVVAMVANATAWINAFPAKGGVSATLSTRTVLIGKRFDCNKASLHCFWSLCVQVCEEPR